MLMSAVIEQISNGQVAALERAIHSIDRLNRWVRSPSYRDAYSSSNGPMKAIYFYKGLAIERWHAARPMSMRRVKAVTKCRDCGGDGRYCDSNGFTHDHCWACHSTGNVTLYFIETEFPNRVRWHTPREKWPTCFKDFEWRYADEEYEETGWLPNQPGEDITVSEAARHLNVIESHFTERPKPYVWHRDWGSGTQDDGNYMLHVGDVDARKCAFCQRTPRPCRWHVRRGRLGWHDRCCTECEEGMKASGRFDSIFDAFPVPEYLLEDEHVQAWLMRNVVGVKSLQPKPAAAGVPF